MMSEQVKQIVEDAIGQVQYARYGLSFGLITVRYVDQTDGHFWKIAFWLKGQVGKEILIPPSQNDEAFKQGIIAAIESSLPAWRSIIN